MDNATLAICSACRTFGAILRYMTTQETVSARLDAELRVKQDQPPVTHRYLFPLALAA